MRMSRITRRAALAFLFLALIALAWRLTVVHSTHAHIAAIENQGGIVEYADAESTRLGNLFRNRTIMVSCYGESKTWDLSPLRTVPNVSVLEIAPRNGAATDLPRGCWSKVMYVPKMSLGTLRDLELFSVDAVALPENWFVGLEKSENLRYIFSTRTHISTEDMESIGQSRSIEDLVFISCGVRDGQLASLSDMNSLERLILYDNAISGQGLRYLKDLPKLERLVLGEPKLEANVAIQLIEQFRGLKYLELSVGSMDTNEVAADVFAPLRARIPVVKIAQYTDPWNPNQKLAVGRQEEAGK